MMSDSVCWREGETAGARLGAASAARKCCCGRGGGDVCGGQRTRAAAAQHFLRSELEASLHDALTAANRQPLPVMHVFCGSTKREQGS